MSEQKVAQETLEKMQRIIAAEADLVHDAAALARRIRAEAGVISDVAVLDLLRRLRQDATGMARLMHCWGERGLPMSLLTGRMRYSWTAARASNALTSPSAMMAKSANWPAGWRQPPARASMMLNLMPMAALAALMASSCASMPC